MWLNNLMVWSPFAGKSFQWYGLSFPATKLWFQPWSKKELKILIFYGYVGTIKYFCYYGKKYFKIMECLVIVPILNQWGLVWKSRIALNKHYFFIVVGIIVELVAIYAYSNDQLSVISFSCISLTITLLIGVLIIILRNKLS